MEFEINRLTSMPVLEASLLAADGTASTGFRQHDGIAPEEKRAELARVLASNDFPATPRKRQILSFVVERGLDHGSDHFGVSAHAIATQVLDRPESFSSARDPIVRIEVAGLRRDLETYYLKSGRGNPLRIEVPRGGYDPVFIYQSEAEATTLPPAPELTGVLEQDAEAELHRVIASPDFAATPRNRRFLAYVVESELRGVPDEISSRLIGIRVFDRGPDFNPHADPIVRIEAGKLRRNLEVYYLKSGRCNPLRISMPKGAYRPVFLFSS